VLSGVGFLLAFYDAWANKNNNKSIAGGWFVLKIVHCPGWVSGWNPMYRQGKINEVK